MKPPEGIAIRRLDRESFLASAGEPMEDITRDPAAALDVDIWNYAEVAMAVEFPDRNTSKWDVRYVYRSGDRRHQHVFVRTHQRRLFLVIVLSAVGDGHIVGHHVLDLKEFGT